MSADVGIARIDYHSGTWNVNLGDVQAVAYLSGMQLSIYLTTFRIVIDEMPVYPMNEIYENFMLKWTNYKQRAMLVRKPVPPRKGGPSIA
jgi:hypothetical protein